MAVFDRTPTKEKDLQCTIGGFVLFRFWRHLIAEKHQQQPKGPLKTTMPNEAVSLTTSMFITKDTCSFMYIR